MKHHAKPSPVTLKIWLTDNQAAWFDEDPGAALYLRSYDIEAEPFLGSLEFTHDPAKAITWPNAMAAVAAWRAQCVHEPIRDIDGKPNRPLTAFTIEIEFVER